MLPNAICALRLTSSSAAWPPCRPTRPRERLAAALTILPPADAPVTPTLEVISPELTAVRLRRMLAAVFMKAGRELDAEMELALLPVEARSL